MCRARRELGNGYLSGRLLSFAFYVWFEKDIYGLEVSLYILDAVAASGRHIFIFFGF